MKVYHCDLPCRYQKDGYCVQTGAPQIARIRNIARADCQEVSAPMASRMERTPTSSIEYLSGSAKLRKL